MKYQISEVGKAFLNMTKLTELIDKKANHECNTRGGTCDYCEQINAEIYTEQNIQDQEPIVAHYIPRENGKTGDTKPF